VSQKAPPLSVLIVCYGNICRSPTGEFLMRNALQEAGLAERYTVASAGVRALVGHAAAPGAATAAAAHGVSLEGHQARHLTVEMALQADHLIAMDEVVEEEILILTGDRAQVELWPVDDPYGGPAAAYEIAFDVIHQHVVEWVGRGRLAPAHGDTRTRG
jgi:protein-tyrosine phosphatase